MTDTPLFPLTFTRLRFVCETETTLNLGGRRAGSNLRGALLAVMRRAVCTGDLNDPLHVAACPVCWLAASNEQPGVERRGYTISPPLDLTKSLAPEERFAFRIGLFGEAIRMLPYFVLAVPEIGRVGVGPGKGRFALRQVWAERLEKEALPVLKEGENLVYPPQEVEGHPEVLQAAEKILKQLTGPRPRIRLHFQSPLRLIHDKHLLKIPDFGIFFAHVLKRIDSLAIQHAGWERRPEAERKTLWRQADRVRLLENRTEWVEVPSGSARTGKRTWISGLVGAATYSAPVETWTALMPWLVWGEITQVGKSTVKGNGIFKIMIDEALP